MSKPFTYRTLTKANVELNKRV
uniref:Uncharacterized protein n=1 Tax=Rhizophora mucronata TaxID=61149 RepID=A0A2P2NUD0_RHIMU